MTPYRISDFNHFGGLIELFLILNIDALQNVKKSSTIFTMKFAAKDVTMATRGALKCSYKIETKFVWVKTRKVLSSGTEQNQTVSNGWIEQRTRTFEREKGWIMKFLACLLTLSAQTERVIDVYRGKIKNVDRMLTKRDWKYTVIAIMSKDLWFS